METEGRFLRNHYARTVPLFPFLPNKQEDYGEKDSIDGRDRNKYQGNLTI